MPQQSDAISSLQSERFLSALVGKPIIVHTLVSGQETHARFGAAQAGTIYGRLEANYSDALVLDIGDHGQPGGGKILVYKQAIVAVEAPGAATP
jgi:hypothetical protein